MMFRSAPVLLAAGILLISSCASVQEDNALVQEDNAFSEEVIALEDLDLAEMQELADQGNAAAQFNLGLMYANGVGIIEDDEEAMRRYRMAVEQGLAEAPTYTGYYCSFDADFNRGLKRASRWYRMAAEQGLAEAQYSLGLMYFTGSGVPWDVVRAHTWFNLAAAQGTASARTVSDRLENEMTSREIWQAKAKALEIKR